MATEHVTSDYDLLHLKVAIEHQSAVLETILRTVQDVQHMSMKTDKRVGLLETDVQRLLSYRSTHPKVQDFQTTATGILNSDSSSIKEEISEMIQTELTELKSVVHEEAFRHGTMCIQHQDELLSKLDKVDQVILPMLSEISEEMKTTASHLEILEKGTRALENSMNNNSTKLNCLQENLIPKSEITNKFQTLIEAAKLQKDCNDQVFKVKEEVTSSLTQLTDAAKTLSSTVQAVKNELEPKEGIEETISKHCGALIDQLLSEGQVMQGVIQQSKSVSRFYTCDFLVEDFKGYIGSGERQYSQHWYIDQAKTYVKGNVFFKKNKMVEVWLVHGCYQSILGKDPAQGGSNFYVTVTALGQPGCSGENKKLGKEKLQLKESDIDIDCDGLLKWWGWRITTVRGSDLKSKNFVEDGRLFLRYEISVS